MKCSLEASSFSLLALCALALPGCGGSEDAPNAPPSDRFFRGVFAGNAGDGSANILLFDPAVSKARGNGSGNVPEGERAAFVELFSGDQAISLTGSWQPNGTLTATGAAPGAIGGTHYQVNGTFNASTVTASVELVDPADSEYTPRSELTGFDLQAGAATAFCGSYSGSSSGAWNFVVRDTSEVTGAYSDGPLSGSATGVDVNLNWTYPSGFFCSAGGGGAATGAINEVQTISGQWSGTACGDPYSGSWQGSPCTSPVARVVAEADASFTCDAQDPASGPVCCPAGPCCYPRAANANW